MSDISSRIRAVQERARRRQDVAARLSVVRQAAERRKADTVSRPETGLSDRVTGTGASDTVPARRGHFDLQASAVDIGPAKADAGPLSVSSPQTEEHDKGFLDRLREAASLSSAESKPPSPEPNTGDTELDAYLKQIRDNAEKATAIGEDRTAAQVGQYAARRAVSGAAGTVEGLINEIGYVNNWLEEKLGGGDDGSAGARGSSFTATERHGFGNNREGTAPRTDTIPAGYVPNRDTVTFGDDYRAWLEANTSQEVKDSKAAQVIGDVAEGVGGMAPAFLANFILPGSSLYVMAAGAAGNATQEAMNAGADSGKALMYGAAVGAVEAATEKMFDGVAGIFGGGAADDAVEGLVKKAIKNETAQKAVMKLAGALGEGFEEFVSEFADRVANELIINTDDRSFLSTLGDAGYSFMIGAAVSSFMQTAQGITNAAKADPKVLARQAAESVKTQVEAAKAAEGENLSPVSPKAQAASDSVESGNGREGAPGSPGSAQGDPITITVESGQSALNKPQGLAYMLASSIPQVSDMAPVKALTGNELNDRTKKPSEQIREFFTKIGNSVFRQGFGNVLFNEYGVGGMLNHRPLNRAKMVSLTAAPEVIQKGRIINDDPNWKGRGYRSITFAAPVSINGSTVYVAAVVDQRPDNKFYLTECVDSQGNYVRIKETPSDNTKSGVTAESGVTTGTERVPKNTIPQTGPGYNSAEQKNSRNTAAQSGYAGDLQQAKEAERLAALESAYQRSTADRVGDSVRRQQEDRQKAAQKAPEAVRRRGAANPDEDYAGPRQEARAAERLVALESAYQRSTAELIRQMDEINAQADGGSLGAPNRGAAAAPGLNKKDRAAMVKAGKPGASRHSSTSHTNQSGGANRAGRNTKNTISTSAAENLTNKRENGKLQASGGKSPEVTMGKSVGAKAKNYDIRLPSNEIVHLAEGTRVTNVEVIAGKGRRRSIDEIDSLLARFPETSEEEWQKKKGIGFVEYKGESYRAELHWYEEPTVGKIKWKVKPDKDGNWFYED